jgi:hypothetical protein
MVSTKKRRKKACTKCGISLTIKNWANYDQNKGYYICKPCRKLNDKKHHQNDSEYAKKQNNRYRMRRSAVILAYGNACIICGEDDYSKLTINGDINYLYNTIIQKTGHQIVCHNCNRNKLYKSKYMLKYKTEMVKTHGGCCKECQEERIIVLTLDDKQRLLCYNCKYSKIFALKYPPELEKQAG